MAEELEAPDAIVNVAVCASTDPKATFEDSERRCPVEIADVPMIRPELFAVPSRPVNVNDAVCEAIFALSRPYGVVVAPPIVAADTYPHAPATAVATTILEIDLILFSI